MKNIVMTIKGTVLTIVVDLSKKFGPSKTGKTTIIASTEGNPLIEGTDNIFAGINVYQKSKK